MSETILSEPPAAVKRSRGRQAFGVTIPPSLLLRANQMIR
jgi:hypothetical protein